MTLYWIDKETSKLGSIYGGYEQIIYDDDVILCDAIVDTINYMLDYYEIRNKNRCIVLNNHKNFQVYIR